MSEKVKHHPQNPNVEGLLMHAVGLGGGLSEPGELDKLVEGQGRGTQSQFCYDDQLPKEIRPCERVAEMYYVRDLRSLHGEKVLELLGDDAPDKSEYGTPAVDQLELAHFEQFDLAEDDRVEKLSGKQVLEAWGVVFSDEDSGDKLFQLCKLPKGWAKQPTDHYMHNDLVDDKGRKRASLMYKPDFWDRDASLSPQRRFSIRKIYNREDRDAPYVQFEVQDCGENAFTSSTQYHYKAASEAPREDRLREINEREDAERRAVAECRAWLDDKYPLWRKYTAYWD